MQPKQKSVQTVNYSKSRGQKIKKMKIRTTLLFITLFSCVLLCGTACNRLGRHNQGQASGPSSTNETKEPDAMELHDKLMSSFADDWMERESDPNIYPSYYGGAFIDNDGTFVIAVTGNKEANYQHLIEILGTDNFQVETVQYSYRQMMQVMDRIDSFLFDASIPEDHPVMARFAGAYPDVMDNRVKVMLTTVDNTAINSFKRDISDSPLVVFEQGEIPELF